MTVHYPSFSARDPTRRTRSTAEVQNWPDFANFFCSPQYGAPILIALLRFEPCLADTTRLMFITVQKLTKSSIIIITGRHGLHVRRRPNSAELLSRHECCTAHFELLRRYGRVLTTFPRERERERETKCGDYYYNSGGPNFRVECLPGGFWGRNTQHTLSFRSGEGRPER